MEIFFLDKEQQAVCPKCGSRTFFDEKHNLSDKTIFQIHLCINKECRFNFLGEFES